jgi:hypothetical protein
LEVAFPPGADTDRFLFGEALPRLIVAYPSSERVQFEMLSGQSGVPFTVLGSTNESGKITLRQGGASAFQSDLEPLKQAWRERWAGIFG